MTTLRHHSTTLTWRDRSLIGLEALLAIAAFAGAVGLVGGGIDLGDSAADLPFASPVLGGIALALINGVLPAIVAAGAVRGAGWAPAAHMAIGFVVMAWIVVQVAFIGLTSWLQLTVFAYGAIIAALSARR